MDGWVDGVEYIDGMMFVSKEKKKRKKRGKKKGKEKE